MPERLGVRAVLAARRRLHGVARETPLEPSPWLSERTGHPVHLKLECWQRTNSFKLRGAYNAVAALGRDARARGIVAASAGNHGQGVALAALEFGAAATIFVPDDAPATKKDRIRRLDATLHEVAGGYDAAESAAARWAEATGARFVHPYADPDVIAGQGTIGLEILERSPGVATTLVPVGGGGLIAGIGLVMKSLGDDAVRVIGVQTERTRAMYDALRGGAAGGGAVAAARGPTLADGLAGGVDPASVERVRRLADDVVLVEEAAVAEAIAQLFTRHGVVAEGAGAVGVAALIAGAAVPAGPTVVVISGGTIDPGRLASLLDRG